MVVESADRDTLGRVVALADDGFDMEKKRAPHDVVRVRWEEIIEASEGAVRIAVHRPVLVEPTPRATPGGR